MFPRREDEPRPHPPLPALPYPASRIRSCPQVRGSTRAPRGGSAPPPSATRKLLAMLVRSGTPRAGSSSPLSSRLMAEAELPRGSSSPGTRPTSRSLEGDRPGEEPSNSSPQWRWPAGRISLPPHESPIPEPGRPDRSLRRSRSRRGSTSRSSGCSASTAETRLREARRSVVRYGRPQHSPTRARYSGPRSGRPPRRLYASTTIPAENPSPSTQIFSLRGSFAKRRSGGYTSPGS